MGSHPANAIYKSLHMRKNDLVKALLAIPGNPEISVLDLVANHEADYNGKGTTAGCHADFEVFKVPHHHLPEGVAPFIAICFNTEPDHFQINPSVYETKKAEGKAQSFGDIFQSNVDSSRDDRRKRHDAPDYNAKH